MKALTGLVGIGAIVIGVGLGWMTRQPRSSAQLYRPYFSHPQMFFQSLEHTRPQQVQPKIRGVIVNHHLLATDLISETLQRIEWSDVKRVILLSPNHFSIGHGPVLVSESDWLTPSGILRSDQHAIRSLRVDPLFEIVSPPTPPDHGVYNLTPYIHLLRPTARVIPLMIRDGMSEVITNQLVTNLRPLLNRHTIVIGSFDFSHSATSPQAQAQDQVSTKILQQLDYLNINQVHTDSLPGLSVFLQLMRDQGVQEGIIINQSNSAIIAQQPDRTDVTSYITATFAAPSKKR